MLKKRVLTALVILPLALVLIWFLPRLAFGILSALIVTLCAWEWTVMMGLQHLLPRVLYAVLVTASLGLVFLLPILFWMFLAFGVWCWAIAATLCYGCGQGSLGFSRPFVKSMTGFLMLIPFWAALNWLRNTADGPIVLIVALLFIWAVDTGAYFSGRGFGRHLLIPRVSPKKTWEGLLGGFVLCLIVALVYAFAVQFNFTQIIELCLLTMVTAVFAVFGDLFESMQKRQAGVKDSGHLLPGHGGILDRFDSVIAALPVFFVGYVYFFCG